MMTVQAEQLCTVDDAVGVGENKFYGGPSGETLCIYRPSGEKVREEADRTVEERASP